MPGSFLSRDRHSGFYPTLTVRLCRSIGSTIHSLQVFVACVVLQHWLSQFCAVVGPASVLIWALPLGQ